MVDSRSVEIGRESFFHADGRASASDVPRDGKQIFHRYQIGLFVARDAGCGFEVDFMVARDDADEISRTIAFQYQCLEYELDGFIELRCYVRCGKVVFVDDVGNQFVGDFCPIEQPGGIRFFDFLVRHDSFCLYWLRI